MNDERRGYRFTLRELIVVVVILCVGLGMLGPWLGRTHVPARQTQCAYNLKQLVLACLNFESTSKHLPLASDFRVGLVVPGKNDPGLPSGTSPSGGYSWLMTIQPYLERFDLDRRAREELHDYQIEPFSTAYISPISSVQYLWEVQESDLICPSGGQARLCNGAHSATRYQNSAPAITNYLAIVGTHYDPATTPALMQNGVLVGLDAVLSDPNFKGIRIADITDGTSNTVMLCESREATYASWYDGSTSWTLGNPEGSVPSVDPASGELVAVERGLNYGPDSQHPKRAFFAAGGFYFGLERRWGPSSMHPGGIVNVCFADGSVRGLRSEGLDPNIWVRLITRAGGEELIKDKW